MPLRSNFHAFLHRICEGTEQILLSKENKYITQGETRPENKLGGCNGRTNNTSFRYKFMLRKY